MYMADISHRTATRINQLKGIITDKRFRELTGGVLIEDLSQEVAAPIEAHLVKLHEWYADFANITLEFIEEANAQRLHNPQGFVDGLTPRLIDRMSKQIWDQKNPHSNV